MLEQALRKLVAALLVVFCPSTLLMAERPSAMLYATGAVTLNGMPAAKSMSVFAGDQIATADGSVGSINRSGFSLVIDPNSSVQYQTDSVTILKGKVRVRTSKGMSTRAGSLSVIPNADSARFDLSSDGNTVLIASREGILTLTDGIRTATLEPGYTAKVILNPQEPKPAAPASGQQPAQNPPQPKSTAGSQEEAPKPAAPTSGQQPPVQNPPQPKSTAGGQEEGPKPAATTSGDEGRSKKGLIIIILASAAAGAAIVCILECGGGGAIPISPVTP